MAQKSNLQEWLAENPKMMGALWTLVLILSATGSAVAGGPMSGP